MLERGEFRMGLYGNYYGTHAGFSRSPGLPDGPGARHRCQGARQLKEDPGGRYHIYLAPSRQVLGELRSTMRRSYFDARQLREAAEEIRNADYDYVFDHRELV
jgi:hypothetical protein